MLNTENKTITSGTTTTTLANGPVKKVVVTSYVISTSTVRHSPSVSYLSGNIVCSGMAESQMYTGYCSDSDEDFHYYGNSKGQCCNLYALGNDGFFYI